MTDSGLSTRLRQQSRRAGLMVGITMVLTIAICIFGAAVLFAWLSRPFSDLIPVMAPAAEAPRVEEPVDPGDAPPAAQPEAQEQPAPTIAPPAISTEPAAAADFAPTHQIAPGDSINFRSGPSTADEIIVALSPATPLQYLDEQTDSGDGVVWMRFRNESGQEGWVREIDTEPYQP